MSQKLAAVRWFELPYGRGDIDHVEDLLAEWAGLSEVDSTKEELAARGHHLVNSVLHVLECALIRLLLLYRDAARQRASARGRDQGPIDSWAFYDTNELSHACTDGQFPNGYPLELAEALLTCYALEEPCDLSIDEAKRYAASLVNKLKDIALYQIEPLENWGAQLQRENATTGAALQVAQAKTQKFTAGRKPGAISNVKKFVAGVMTKSELSKKNKELWKVLEDAVSEATDCPLEIDGDKIVETDGGKEYTINRLNQHLAALRNPKTKNSR
jgi:hypothetical protein